MLQTQTQNPLATERKTLFADVIVPVPIPKFFRYRIPFEMNEVASVGKRVIVQFGKRKVYTAIIAEIHEHPPENYQAKYLLDILDDEPSVQPVQLQLWEWIANYYMCTVGEVMNVALPSGLKITSQSKVQLNPDFEYFSEEVELSAKEELLVSTLRSSQSLPYDEIAKLLDVKSIYQIIKTLIGKRAIILFEEVKEKYKPKTVRKIRLKAPFAESEENLQAVFEQLQKKPKQEEILLKYLAEKPMHNLAETNEGGIEKKEITNTFSASSLKTLIKNQVFEEFDVVVSRLEEYELEYQGDLNLDIQLSEAQQEAKDGIVQSFQEKNITLLHGITGSGKTEIYIELIKEALESGSQVLMLLPEIVLTVQMVVRLKKIFGSEMGVYHSKFSDNERVEVWQGVNEGRYNFVLGVRSSAFLPFDSLGLIIVDEEHDPSYKQYDPAPRYNARDLAMVLGQLHGAKVLLGSATPSVESYFLAQQGQYGFVELLQRFGDATLPEIAFADTRKEKLQKKMKNDFTSTILEEMGQCLAKKEQIILFQNRRGYAPYLTCENCNWIPTCSNCSVSLTYHMHSNELRCHYCGYKEAPPRTCVSCGSSKIKMVGIGTEKLEDELKLLLPDVRVQRMDLDTTRKKYSYQKIISDFENQQIDILVGTQMVSKGLDFDHVGLVGVFDVDRLIHFPDFRSHERTFQLITQVSGRAGRRNRKGKVIIQTANPRQALLQKISTHNYKAFFQTEIIERRNFDYPPFFRLIRLVVKHESKEVCDKAAEELGKSLIQKLGKKRILGPEFPIIDRIRNQFLKEIMIKLERGKVDLKKVKSILNEEIEQLRQIKAFRKVNVSPDVDPV